MHFWFKKVISREIAEYKRLIMPLRVGCDVNLFHMTLDFGVTGSNLDLYFVNLLSNYSKWVGC